MIALEHEVRFSKLHEKRAEVLAGLYSRLVGAYHSAKSFVSPLEMQGNASKMDKNREASKKIHGLYFFFEKNRIYLPESLCDILSSFIDDVRRPVLRFSMQLSMEQAGTGDPTRLLEVWTEAVDVFEKDLPVAKTRVEQEFRRMLEPIRNQELP